MSQLPAMRRSPRAGLDLKLLPELQALPLAWVSPALQRPEDSSHPRLHAGLAVPFRQRPGGSDGSRVLERCGKESVFYLGFAAAAPLSEQTAPWLSGLGMRGRWEETGSIRAFSQCSPNVRPPAFRDLPGWMRFLIYPHRILLLSPIPLEPTQVLSTPRQPWQGAPHRMGGDNPFS